MISLRNPKKENSEFESHTHIHTHKMLLGIKDKFAQIRPIHFISFSSTSSLSFSLSLSIPFLIFICLS